jgi:ABC-type branched-subunit amino acid transport system ATPase component
LEGKGQILSSAKKDDFILVTENLTKNFGALRAVNGVNLKVKRGSVLAVIGPNGAGKTTLFNMITGFYPADGGKVIFDSKDITNLPPYEIMKAGMSRSFQVVSIYNELTVSENMALAVQAITPHSRKLFARAHRFKDINERADQLLDRIGLLAKKNQYASTLSHGEQKMLDIGLALSSNPKLLLLDEPTSGLSLEEAYHIIELIQKFSRELTIVIIEHKVEVILLISEQITVLHQGQVIAAGTPEEIQKNEKVQEAYLGGVV